MTETEKQMVEFIGGPFDGHVARFSLGDEPPPEDWVWFVSENVYRILDGHEEDRTRPITSVAIYARQRHGGAWSYGFLGAVSPQRVSKLYPQLSLPFKQDT